MLSAAVGLCAGIVLQISLARLLGPLAFGIFGLATTVQHFGMIAQDGGFRTLLLRETTRPSEGSGIASKPLMSWATGHSFLATVPALCIALLVLGFGFGVAIVLAVLGGAAKAQAGFVSGVLIGRGDFVGEARWQIGSRTAVSLTGIAAATATGDVGVVLFALLAAQAVALMPIFHGVALPRPGLGWSREVSAFMGKLTLLAFLTALYFRAGPFFLYLLSSDLRAVSYFSLVHRLLDAALFVVAPLAQLAFFSSRRRHDALRLDMRACRLGGCWCLLGATVAAAGFVFGPAAVGLVAGDAFRPAGLLVGWFALAFMAAAPNFVMMQILLARNGENAVLASSSVAVGVGLVLNLALIPSLSAPGAAMAVLGSEVALCAMLAGALWRRRASGAAPPPADAALGDWPNVDPQAR